MTVTRPEPEPVPDEPDIEGRDAWLADLRAMLSGQPRRPLLRRGRLVAIRPETHRFVPEVPGGEFSPLVDAPSVATRAPRTRRRRAGGTVAPSSPNGRSEDAQT